MSRTEADLRQQEGNSFWTPTEKTTIRISTGIIIEFHADCMEIRILEDTYFWIIGYRNAEFGVLFTVKITLVIQLAYSLPAVLHYSCMVPTVLCFYAWRRPRNRWKTLLAFAQQVKGHVTMHRWQLQNSKHISSSRRRYNKPTLKSTSDRQFNPAVTLSGRPHYVETHNSRYVIDRLLNYCLFMSSSASHRCESVLMMMFFTLKPLECIFLNFSSLLFCAVAMCLFEWLLTFMFLSRQVSLFAVKIQRVLGVHWPLN